MPDDTDEHLAALLWLFLGGGDPPQQCLHPTQARNGIADFPLTDAGWCDAELLCCFWPCQFALLTKPLEIDPEDLAQGASVCCWRVGCGWFHPVSALLLAVSSSFSHGPADERAGDGYRTVGSGSSNRTRRGGSFINPAVDARSAGRYSLAPTIRNNLLGLRPARASRLPD